MDEDLREAFALVAEKVARKATKKLQKSFSPFL